MIHYLLVNNHVISQAVDGDLAVCLAAPQLANSKKAKNECVEVVKVLFVSCILVVVSK